MPWVSSKVPAAPSVGASAQGDTTNVHWQTDNSVAKIAIQAKDGSGWHTVKIVPARAGNLTIPRADAIAVTALDRFGNASTPKVLGIR